MCPRTKQDFRGVSLKRALVEEIEKFIAEYPQYKSIADFIHEATRVRMENIRTLTPPRFEQVNSDANGVKILDRTLRGVAQIYFKPTGAWCDICESDSCEHITYALTLPDVQKTIQKKRKNGWKLPEVS